MTKMDACYVGRKEEEEAELGVEEGEMEEERENEASFPLAACIIEKLAGLYMELQHVETN